MLAASNNMRCIATAHLQPYASTQRQSSCKKGAAFNNLGENSCELKDGGQEMTTMMLTQHSYQRLHIFVLYITHLWGLFSPHFFLSTDKSYNCIVLFFDIFVILL